VATHEHELTLLNNLYGGMGFACEKCQEYGTGYAYHCELCQYDLHPKCALDQ
jgi:nucleoredoxin